MQVPRIAEGGQGFGSGRATEPGAHGAHGQVHRGNHEGRRTGRDRRAPAESKGKRVRVENGRTTVIDGPFTESKELVASYAVLNVKSMDEAVHWTGRFLEALGGGECEIRPIFEPGDFGGH